VRQSLARKLYFFIGLLEVQFWIRGAIVRTMFVVGDVFGLSHMR
jgi:hypothetical protein